MPIHDWTRVEAGIFHDFHVTWIAEIKRSLNSGLLSADYYALAEQIAGGFGPNVLTLQKPGNGNGSPSAQDSFGGIALATAAPRVQYHLRAEPDQYAAKANAVVIHHVSNHRVVAMVEIVSPGNKNSRHGLRAFVDKAVEMLRADVHLLIADLFPPGPRNPEGIHKAIWDELIDNDFTPPADRPLTLVSYIGGPVPEAFVEPTAFGVELTAMPLFLEPDTYINVPLEATYQSAWEAVPAFWREALTQAKA